MPAPSFFRDLGLFVVPNFLDPEYGAGLRLEIAAAPAEKALIVRPNGAGCLDEGVRKVEDRLPPKEIRADLKKRFHELIPDLEKHFGVRLAGCESPQCLIYRAGDFFKPHTDGGGLEKREDIRRRRVSAVVFLNRESQEPAEDAYGDGHLTFYGLIKDPPWDKLALPLKAEPGLLIAFPSDKLHEVTPISHGRRFTLVTWFYGPDSEQPPEVATPGD
jgi:SM-20-related protein